MNQTAHPTSAVVVALFGFTALAIAMGIGRFAFTPTLPMMQDDAEVSVGQRGWLATANYIGYLIGALSAIGMRIRPITGIRVESRAHRDFDARNGVLGEVRRLPTTVSMVLNVAHTPPTKNAAVPALLPLPH